MLHTLVKVNQAIIKCNRVSSMCRQAETKRTMIANIVVVSYDPERDGPGPYKSLLASYGPSRLGS